MKFFYEVSVKFDMFTKKHQCDVAFLLMNSLSKLMITVVSERNISNLVCEGNTTETARDKAEVFANTFAKV